MLHLLVECYNWDRFGTQNELESDRTNESVEGKKSVTLFEINFFCDKTYIEVFGGAIEPALNIAGPHRK